MKKMFFTALLLSQAIFFSCNTGASGDPKAVLSQFFDALKKKDIIAAKKLATEDSKQLLDLMETGMKMDTDPKGDDKFDKTKMEFGETKIDGDKATVAVKETSSGETMHFSLKKEKGDWKVAFDKATMMGNAMEKMNEKGINPTDSINKAMEELKGLNMDSLKRAINEGMKEGMKAMDSVNKN